MEPVWAIVSPTGRILTDTKFTTEDEAWRIALAFVGTPDPEAIEQAKQKGFRAIRLIEAKEEDEDIGIPPKPRPRPDEPEREPEAAA